MSPDSSSRPPVTFTLFVLSLAASAEIHLGLMPPPGSDKPGQPNLVEASHLIELLAMLREKTRRNLDESEEKLLEGVLYDLRLRYVEAAGTGKKVTEP